MSLKRKVSVSSVVQLTNQEKQIIVIEVVGEPLTLDTFIDALEGSQEPEDDFICPVCGSCGEEGCCGIDGCKEGKGLYCEGNKQTYKAMERQWGIMWKALQKIFQEGWGGSLGIAIKAIEDVEDDMKLEAYYDAKSGEGEAVK
jgi:hypothetical protein